MRTWMGMQGTARIVIEGMRFRGAAAICVLRIRVEGRRCEIPVKSGKKALERSLMISLPDAYLARAGEYTNLETAGKIDPPIHSFEVGIVSSIDVLPCGRRGALLGQ